MSKKRLIRKDSIIALENSIRTVYDNKYYNLFMKSFKWEGIDREQQDYIMRQFWAVGSTACFNIKNLNEAGFAPFATINYNMYDFPAQVQLINKRGVPFIPSETLTVGKQAVLGWIQPNHKPLSLIVSSYIDRMVQVDMVINTNLQVHKMPFVLGVTPTDRDKAQDLLDRILNNEIGVIMDPEELNMIKSFVFNTPYIIDKLYSYRTSLENELLTYLGLDNAISDDTKDRLIVDQVNANNAVINANRNTMLESIKDWLADIKEVFGFDIKVSNANETSVSVHDKLTTKEEEVEKDA